MNRKKEGIQFALNVKVAPEVRGWTEIKLLGFKESQAGNHIVGKFQILANNEIASMIFTNPIALREINRIMIVAGLTPFSTQEEVILPEIGDDDMLGMDVVILGNIVKSGDFLNIKDLKIANFPNQAPF